MLLYGGAFDLLYRQFRHTYEVLDAKICLASHAVVIDMCGTLFTVPGVVKRYGDMARIGSDVVTQDDLRRAYASVMRGDPRLLGDVKSFDAWWSRLP